MLRVSTNLDPAVEDLIHRVIGCLMEVHKALGPGLREPIYQRASALELTAANIPFEPEKRFPVIYRGKILYTHWVDFVVAERLIVELKSVDRLHPVHHAQVRSELKISKLRAALLVNFNVALLPDGIRRIVL